MTSSVRMMITQRGGDLKDIPLLRVYIKRPEDYAIIKQVIEAKFPGIPHLFVISDVCRTDWLVEIEAMAFVKTALPETARPTTQDVLSEGKTPVEAKHQTEAAEITVSLAFKML